MSVVDVQLVSRLPIQLLTVHQALLCFAEIELMQHSPASSNAHSAGCTGFWMAFKENHPNSQSIPKWFTSSEVRASTELDGSQWFSTLGSPEPLFSPRLCPHFRSPPKHFFLLPQESYEPFWKPSVAPYVVSFWVRQSLRHAYARRVFPCAKQIEETLTRSPYAALRKRGFRLRQTCDDKARTENVKGGF